MSYRIAAQGKLQEQVEILLHEAVKRRHPRASSIFSPNPTVRLPGGRDRRKNERPLSRPLGAEHAPDARAADRRLSGAGNPFNKDAPG